MSLPERDDSNVRQGPWARHDQAPAASDPYQPPPAPDPPPTPEPTSLRQRIHARFLKLLGHDDPPEVVAASFALGVFIAFTPLFGLHALMAISLALLLRLKKVDVLLGTLVVNPITFAPVSALAIPLGRFLLQAERALIHDLPWRDLIKSPKQFWSDAGPAMREVLIHWGVGMSALSVIAGVLTYLVLVRLIRHRRARMAARHSGEHAREGTPQSPA